MFVNNMTVILQQKQKVRFDFAKPNYRVFILKVKLSHRINIHEL
jgi:hypothetical protein